MSSYVVQNFFLRIFEKGRKLNDCKIREKVTVIENYMHVIKILTGTYERKRLNF